MGNPATVLIGRATAGARIADALEAAGYRCPRIGGNDAALADEIALHRPNVSLVPGDSDADRDTIRQLKTVEGTRYVPVAAVVNAGGKGKALRLCYEAGADDVFEAGTDPREIVARLRALVRVSTMESELLRRAATAGEFGLSVGTTLTVEPPEGGRRLLVVGLDAAGLEAMCPRLSRAGLSFVAEPDPYRARSRIEGDDGEPFDGALVYIRDGEQRGKCLYFCHSVRNDRRMFDLPLFVAADPGAFADAAEAYSEGASVFEPTPLDCESLDVHLRLLLRGRQLKRVLGRRIASALGPRTADTLGHVYSKEFLELHLGRMIADGKAQETRSTAILFFIPTIGETVALYSARDGEVLRQQMADWLSGLVRIEDVVGRAGADEFLVLLPETSESDADVVRRRVLGVLQESKFRLSDSVPVAVEVYVQSGMTTIAPDDTLDTLIRRAAAALE